jgi:hypothetical protein
VSDQEHDEHETGAHEVDKMPSRRLFNLLFGLSALTLAACIGVVQLFNRQVDSILDTRATKVSFQLSDYRQEMVEIESNWGVLVIDDDDGVAGDQGGKGPHEDRRYQMPLAEARKRVLAEPEKWLKAGPAYRGWTNPDPKAPAPSVMPGRPMPRRGGAPMPGMVPAPGGARPPGVMPMPAPGGAVPPGVVPTPGQPQPGAPAQPGGAAAPAAPAQPGGAGPAAPAQPGGAAAPAAPAQPGGAAAPAAPAQPSGAAAPAAPAQPKGEG